MAAESTEDRFDTLTDSELLDHVESGHVDAGAGRAELARRADVAAAKAPAGSVAVKPEDGKQGGKQDGE